MTRFAGLLATLFCAGCVASTDMAAVQPQAWRQLQMGLAGAPADVRQALTKAAEARLPSAAGTELQPSEAPKARATLVDILAHTDDRTLLPDAEFDELQRVVLGENRTPAHGYAEVLASYLLDRDFTCRQPAYQRYFQHRYQDVGATNCGEKVPLSVFTSYDGAQILWLDPKRVREVHLLFAGKSESMASRFGHTALRLVVCPEGTTAGADCDANLFEHLVLGYQAHVDELSLKTLKALTGDYRAYLFANQFLDLYQEYAIAEFREIHSLPLRLDAAQRESMVRELADIHWRYAGSYNFITRNCATMLQDALRLSWPAFAADPAMLDGFLRPDTFFEALKTSALTEGEKLASPEDAERSGYYFSSPREFYLRALQVVGEAMARPGFSTLEGYLETEPSVRRARWSEDAGFMSRLASDQHLREAQLMLEEYACLRSERFLTVEAAKYFEQQDFLGRVQENTSRLDEEHARVFLDCLIEPIRARSRPRQSPSGIPAPTELPEVDSKESVCRTEKARTLLREAIVASQQADSEQWQLLQQISRYWSESVGNVKMLKRM